MSEPLIIFDTTLRDGEQSPGASMNLGEKLEVARALKDLGVDVIEAGFPIASPGDFEAVQTIARQVAGPTICGLAQYSATTSTGPGWLKMQQAAARLPRHVVGSSRVQAEDGEGRDHSPGRRRRAAGEDVLP